MTTQDPARDPLAAALDRLIIAALPYLSNTNPDIIAARTAIRDASPMTRSETREVLRSLDEVERDMQGAAEQGGDFEDGAEWVVNRVRFALAAPTPTGRAGS
jgi:hypothetical protein